MVVSSLAGELRVWYDARPGTCEVQDTSLRREEQRCPAVPARAVTFWDGLKQDATAYACLQHAGPLAALADRSPYIEAQVTFLR